VGLASLKTWFWKTCLDWAKHRRRKAAAKTHMPLNLQNLLPGFVVVDTAAEHDNQRARELCADLKSGESCSHLLEPLALDCASLIRASANG